MEQELVSLSSGPELLGNPESVDHLLLGGLFSVGIDNNSFKMITFHDT